jgi:hemolysin activation/secretion protein
MTSFKIQSIALACCALSAWPTLTQAQIVIQSPKQGIDQSSQLLRESLKPKPLARVDTLGLESNESIDQLISVHVLSPLLKPEIERYWQGWLGRAVSIEQIQAFHSWFYEKARQSGSMAYAQTEVVKEGSGQRLVVRTLQPKVGTVRILSAEPALAHEYADLLKRRFEVDFRPGMPLDTLGLDQRLDSVSYDLPIELDATLRAVGPEQLDLIVNITAAKHKPGQVLTAIEQWTNHGLKQYGRAQILAMMNVAAWREKSSVTLLGQISEGLGYARAEYEDLLPDLGARWRLYGAHAISKSILSGLSTTKNNSQEQGFGLTRVLGGHRDVVFKGSAEISARESRTHLISTGIWISKISDHQIRLRLTADNERLSPQSSRMEVGVTVGDYIHVMGPPLPEGQYKRLDAMGKTQVSLDAAGKVSLMGRIKGQWSNRNMDSYNQIALGGISGVRAYTSVDGVGDRGVIGTVELNRAFSGGWSLGAFYDGGYVQSSVTKLASQTYNHDVLQAVGLKVQGQAPGVDYSVTWAKGVGGYKSWQSTNIESKPNNHRVWAGLTFFF